MVLHAALDLFLLGVVASTIGVKLVQASDVSVEDAVRILQEKMTQMEKKLSLLEEMDSKLERKQTAFSTKLGAIQKLIVDQKSEILAKVSEVEKLCVQPTRNVSAGPHDVERSTKFERHISLEIDQLKTASAEALKKIESVKKEAVRGLEREQLKTDILQDKISETRGMLSFFLAANDVAVDVFKRDVSVTADDLKLGFDGIPSNLSEKIRNIENKISKVEKDCVSGISVSRLNETVQKLDRTVGEMRQSLGNYSSQIKGLDGQFDALSCTGDPPSVENGKAVDFERRPGSVVQYECDPNFVMAGNSRVLCKLGKWEGQPPQCRFFDASFTLVAYKHNTVTCYSDANYQKITFSRVVDTGTGESLPGTVKTYTRGKAAVLEFLRSRDMDKYGIFECRYEDKHGPVGAIIPLQYPTRMQFKNASIIANIGDSVELEAQLSFISDSTHIWRRNGLSVPAWNGKFKVVIPSVRMTDGGIYEFYLESGRTYFQTFGRLIVRKCKANLYGDRCNQTCPPCYNGGICHDFQGICVCPPGFIGLNCEVACEEGRFGADCSKTCPQSNCLHFKFCKPDPYGCSCAPGYNGTRCDETCGTGWYGADCKQPCHCALGHADCNLHTGACPGGCLSGWTGQSCEIEVPS